MSLNLQEIHQLALSAVDDGRQILKSYFGRLSKVREKERAGLVSEADTISEAKITSVLLKGRPDIPVLGEEASFEKGLDSTKLKPATRWVLDPLDGTTNYVHGFYAYAISLALEWEGKIVYGIVDLPALGTTYHAILGQGAFKNDVKIEVSHRQKLKQALVATGFSSSRKELLHDQVRIFSEIVEMVRGVRRAGSAAYDLCLVAEGVYDAYWETGLQAWDVAAGALLVTEAGGQVTDQAGKEIDIYKGSILATNRLLHQDLLKKMQV